MDISRSDKCTNKILHWRLQGRNENLGFLAKKKAAMLALRHFISFLFYLYHFLRLSHFIYELEFNTTNLNKL